MKIIKDTSAVSPVVASLMLIMVVAGSAAFLSSMMQNMNQQTDSVAGKSTSVERTSLKINIIGSDLTNPAVKPLIKAYNDKHLGVMLQLQESEILGGTSNVPIGEVGTGVADIGVPDRQLFPDERGKYPDLVIQKLGTSGIVVIVNNGVGGTFSKNDLRTNYSSGSLKAFQMTGSSGTQKAFLQYIGMPSISSNIDAVTGSAGMLEAVKNWPNSIGFIEYGYVDSREERGTDVYIAGLYNESNFQTYTNMSHSNFTLAVANNTVNNSYYPLELAHPLLFVTRGNPSLVDSFIKWARSFEGQDILEKNGYISFTREFN